MKFRTAALALAVMAGSGCVHQRADQTTSCDGSTEANRRIVMSFYTEGLVNRSPASAFDRYMAPGFVEHKPDIPGGTRGATADFLADLMRDLPEARWDVVRTIAERDMVFVHARMTPAPGAPPYALADIFRVENCRIVEHWDVVAGPPKESPNPNPRF